MADSVPFPTSGQTGTPAVADAAKSAHGAIDKAASKVTPIVDKSVTAAHQAIDSAAAAAVPAIDWVAEKARAAQEAQQRLVKTTTDLITEKPITALAVALGVGILIGRLSGISFRR
jgi:ElaB/YqjD/DUF883 family membrane-anchored ribosome-binding protein